MKKIGLVIVGGLIGGATVILLEKRNRQKKYEEKDNKINKFKSYYNVLNQWLALEQEGKNISDYFLRYDYKNIAVYGLGELGTRLIDELENTPVEVMYGIDKSIENASGDIKVYALGDDIAEKVDAIVVTPFFAFSEIEKSLSDMFDAKIISLQDVIFDF